MPKISKNFVSAKEVAWEAVKAYVAPLAILGTIVKFKEKAPGWLFYSMLLSLIASIVFRVWRELATKRRLQKRLARYETLSQLTKLGPLDKNFTYHIVSQDIRVIPPDGYFEHVHEGVNSSSQNQNQIKRALGSDSPSDFEAMQFEAFYDLGGGWKSAPSAAEARDNSKTFLITISLGGSVIMPQQQLRLRVKGKWPGAMARKEDYLAFSLAQFANPVSMLRVSCSFPTALHEYALYELEADIPLPVQGPEELVDSTSREKWYRYRFEIQNPKNAYILEYTRP